jgi:hypothetical protein
MSLPPVTQRQPRNFYTTKSTGREKARLLHGPILDKARPFAEVSLLEPRVVPGARVGIRWQYGSHIVCDAKDHVRERSQQGTRPGSNTREGRSEF